MPITSADRGTSRLDQSHESRPVGVVRMVAMDSPGGISGDGAAVVLGKEVAAVIVRPMADHPDRVLVRVVGVDAAIDALLPSERRRANDLRTVALLSFGNLLLAQRRYRTVHPNGLLKGPACIRWRVEGIVCAPARFRYSSKRAANLAA